MVALTSLRWFRFEGDLETMATSPCPVWCEADLDPTDFYYALYDYVENVYSGTPFYEPFVWQEGIALYIKSKAKTNAFITLSCFDVDQQVNSTIVLWAK